MKIVTLRKATRADLPAILHLYVQAGFDKQEEIDVSTAAGIWERIQQYPNYSIYLSSNLKREAARRFYEGLGFQKHGYSFVVDPSQLTV